MLLFMKTVTFLMLLLNLVYCKKTEYRLTSDRLNLDYHWLMVILIDLHSAKAEIHSQVFVIGSTLLSVSAYPGLWSIGQC